MTNKIPIPITKELVREILTIRDTPGKFLTPEQVLIYHSREFKKHIVSHCEVFDAIRRDSISSFAESLKEIDNDQ